MEGGNKMLDIKVKNDTEDGIVVEVIGTVVTVRFPITNVPKINDALIIS